MKTAAFLVLKICVHGCVWFHLKTSARVQNDFAPTTQLFADKIDIVE